MIKRRWFALAALLLVAGTLANIAEAAEPDVAAAELGIVPWPKEIKREPGTLPLTAHSRIVTENHALDPLAKILADEIFAETGLRLATASGHADKADIELTVDSALAKEAYQLTIGEHVAIRGGAYGAVAMGSATLLQLLPAAKGPVALPCLKIDDEPKSGFRGLMIDVARHFHSIESLKQIVELCRFYKVRYLQLHLTDDESFMFPSKAYPLLTTKNQHEGKSYTIDEFKDLVAYADARGVTIIPEYEMPGHSAAANRAMHNLFIIKDTKPYEHHASINFVNDDVLKAVTTIVGEMCDVFQSSPYFHIGGDEADLEFAAQNVDFKAAMKKYNLPDQHELYRRFLGQMDEVVKKHGKQMLVWEGFEREGKVAIPKDVIVMPYEIAFYMPEDLVSDGYKVINASWTPLYVVNEKARPPAEIYAWNLFQFKPVDAKPADAGHQVPPSDAVLGAEMCAWEQKQEVELPSLRQRLPAMIERIWNPTAGRTYQDFDRRLQATDALLDLVLHLKKLEPSR